MPDALDHVAPRGKPWTAPEKKLHFSFAALALLLLFGLGVAYQLILLGALDFSRPRDAVAPFLFAELEPPVIAGLLLLLVALWGIFAQPMVVMPERFERIWGWLRAQDRLLWLLLPAAVVAVTFLGRYVVYHDFALSMDEYLAEYQAGIFARGQWRAPVPVEWQALAPCLTPHFVIHSPVTQTWVTSYWPLHSLLMAPFVALGVPGLCSALLAGVSVWLVADIARREWPEAGPRAPWLAALLLAASAQFLITAMTSYSMGAHLCLTLLWVWLLQRDQKWSLALAPLLGVVALGLHKPNVHALLILPFCWRIFRQRRWGVVAWFSVVYVAGLALCYFWAKLTQLPPPPTLGAVPTDKSAFAVVWRWLSEVNFPTFIELPLRFSTLVLLLDWQTLIASVAALFACLHWRTLSPLLRDLALGAFALWLFHVLGRLDQGHGWGYRYCHAALGNLVLLAVAGLEFLRRDFGRHKTALACAAALLVAGMVQLPTRAWQVEQFVRPYAAADAYLARQKGELVIIRHGLSWYSLDLIRNPPDLSTRPLRVNAAKVDRLQLEVLQSKPSIRLISPAELEACGVRSTGPRRP